MSCMYGKCRSPVTHRIVNPSGGKIAELCDSHLRHTWATSPHIGLEAVPIGDRKEDEVENKLPIPAAGAVGLQRGGDDTVDPPDQSRMAEGRRDRLREAGGSALLAPAGAGAAAANAGRGILPLSPARETFPVPSGLILWERLGTYQVTDEQADILTAPCDPGRGQIKTDGTIYMPWTEYASRLTAAFGPLGWGMQPLEKPMIQDNTVYVHYLLVVRGHPVADAVQGHPYWRTNRNMDYGDAVEAAKSECLRRCCKQMGMLLEPWDAAWREKWKAEYAVRVRGGKGGQWVWRRKDAPPFADEMKEGYTSQSEYQRPWDLEEDTRDHIEAIRRGD